MKIARDSLTISFELPFTFMEKCKVLLDRRGERIIALLLFLISIASFYYYYNNGQGLAYNDARSHLDISRRVVEGLKPGLAQIGSVWLPLPHLLNALTVWNDFMWHTGLSGAAVSMVSFVYCGVLIYKYLKSLGVGMFGRLFACSIFTLNLNVLYLSATAMTELPLLAAMTAASYHLMLWYKDNNLLDMIKTALWVMVSTLIRYDGWFLLVFIFATLGMGIFRKRGKVETEGKLILFGTLAGYGVILWFLWNLLIFKDPLYFAFGPFSAHEQQKGILSAGELFTKGNIYYSFLAYFYATLYNTYSFITFMAILGFSVFLVDKKIDKNIKIASLALISPFFFNIIALYLGHSVLFVYGLFKDTWFNVRYGMMLVTGMAVFIGYLVDKVKDLRWVFVGVFSLITIFAFIGKDAATIDDALIGASGKNVSEVSSWIKKNATSRDGFILISAASHDAIIFSSGLPMSRFIHEGTGKYWELATENPQNWATWIILRTNDMSDWTFREIADAPGFKQYNLVGHYPFADIYELKPEVRSKVITEPILGKLK